MGQNFVFTSTGSWPEVVGLTVSHFGAKLLGMMGRNLHLRWAVGGIFKSQSLFTARLVVLTDMARQ